MPPEGPRHPAAETPGQPSWIAPVKPVVPDHELLRRIGGGSYGDVWLARSIVGTLRAVKVVFRDRFLDARPYEREFNGIQKFEPLSRGNEGFIDILQIGRNDAEGYFYYVMELADDAGPGPGGTSSASPHPPPRSDPELSGTRVTRPSEASAHAINPDTYVPKTLAKALFQRGRLPVSECLELGITLNLALAHLHNAGLIHRDIKPSNLIFVGGVPKLADIGLVIEFAEARSYVGTEGFIPPEGPNSPQADLYSLGKVLYEAGMGKDRKDFPEPPTQIADVPNSAELLEFNAILFKACAANVKDRYQSAEEMNADLALLQSGGSVRKQRKLASQLRFVQRAGAGVTALAALIAVGWLWQARQTRLVRNLAAEKTRLADSNAHLAEENRERLVRLDTANGVRLMDAGDLSGALLWFAEALPLVTNKPAEESIHRIRIQQVLKQSPCLARVLSHEGSAVSSAFSPDGCRIVTGSWPANLLRVWDAESGQLLVGPLSLPGDPNSVRYSGDGRRLLVSSWCDEGRRRLSPPPLKGFAAVLEASTGREVWPRKTNVLCAAFSPDDRWLAVAHTNFIIEILDASDGRHIVELCGHTNEITMLSFARDGSRIASASRDQTVRLWSLPSGEPTGRPIRHEQPVEWVLVGPDARRLATAESAASGQSRGFVHTWETRTGAEIGPPIPVLEEAFGLAFDAATGRRLLVGSRETWVTVLDSETHLPVCQNLAFELSVVRCWAFSPDGLRFAAGSDDGTCRVWDLETGRPLTPFLRHLSFVDSVHFSPDGSRLLTTSDDGTAKVWALALRAEAAPPLSLPAAPPKLLDSVIFLPRVAALKGEHLLVGLEDATIRSVDLRTLTEDALPMAGPGDEPAGTVVLDGSGRQWAAAVGFHESTNQAGVVGLWRRENERTLYFALPHAGPVKGLAFTPKGDTLVTFTDNRAGIWNTVDGTLKREVQLPDEASFRVDFGGPLDPSLALAQQKDNSLRLFDLTGSHWVGEPFPDDKVNAFMLSPDRMRFATGGGDLRGRIRDARSAKPLLLNNRENLGWIEWSPDGRQVVTAGLSESARLFDSTSGELAVAPMRLGERAMLVAHFSSDGRFVVARGDEHLARVWDASTAEPVTPILHFPTDVRAAMITDRNRLMVISEPCVIQAWNLIETRLSPSVIADYAKFLSGRRLSAGGVLLPIPAKELAELAQSLRIRAPQLFE